MTPYQSEVELSTCSPSTAGLAAKALRAEDVKMKKVERRGVIFHGPVLSGGSYQQLPV